jgi:hypothetical protein
MKKRFAITLAVVSLLGCTSSQTLKPTAFDLSPREKAIYFALKDEPIPLPKETPYDGNSRQREVFNAGFRDGWDCAISGAMLHGTFGTPTDLTDDLRKVWSAGWKAGGVVGSNRWLMEDQRMYQEQHSQLSAGPYGSPAAGSPSGQP